MKVYYVDEPKCHDSYLCLIKHLVTSCDYFSLVYFSHDPDEPMSATTSHIANQLQCYEVASFFSNSWPLTTTLNQNNHIYRVIIYRCDKNVVPILAKQPGIYAWDYPDAPMDLCFYKNRLCMFASSAHEKDAYLFTDDSTFVDLIHNAGIDVFYHRETDQNKVFSFDSFHQSITHSK